MSIVQLDMNFSGAWFKPAGILEVILNSYSRACHRIICREKKFMSSKKNLCLLKCSVGEVVSIDNQSCLSNCPENEFVFESNCVEVCPEGTQAESGDTVCVLVNPTPDPSPGPSPTFLFQEYIPSLWDLYVWSFVVILLVVARITYVKRRKRDKRFTSKVLPQIDGSLCLPTMT